MSNLQKRPVRSSPRPWGCFYIADFAGVSEELFPTPVGVFPQVMRCVHFLNSLPHARGGVSCPAVAKLNDFTSSPRPWGCFRIRAFRGLREPLFPTPVGVFPDLTCPLYTVGPLPHARGGVSASRSLMFVLRNSSPRPWGCFRSFTTGRDCASLFPTPVGVFLVVIPVALRPAGLPHARGGVSRYLMQYRFAHCSSPRPWGCFSDQSCGVL